MKYGKSSNHSNRPWSKWKKCWNWLKLADRQKSADEREIESLRRALRRMQSPRGHKDTPHEQGGG